MNRLNFTTTTKMSRVSLRPLVRKDFERDPTFNRDLRFAAQTQSACVSASGDYLDKHILGYAVFEKGVAMRNRPYCTLDDFEDELDDNAISYFVKDQLDPKLVEELSVACVIRVDPSGFAHLSSEKYAIRRFSGVRPMGADREIVGIAEVPSGNRLTPEQPDEKSAKTYMEQQSENLYWGVDLV